jgi:hypothetical protein
MPRELPAGGGRCRPRRLALRTEIADDHWTGTAIIRLNQEYPPEVVQGLAEFSHLVVVWHFHRSAPSEVTLHAWSPRGNPAWPATGTFVHRNHRSRATSASKFRHSAESEPPFLHETFVTRSPHNACRGASLAAGKPEAIPVAGTVPATGLARRR